MFFVTLFSIVVIAVNGQRSTPDHINNPNYVGGPKLYSFNYRSILKDGLGESSRSETSDGTGKVEGSYSLTNAEGHYRVVEYVADQDGFRAVIRTNEPGTKSMNPANVLMQSEFGANEYNSGVRRPASEEPVSPNSKPVAAPDPARAPVRQPVYSGPSGRNPRVNAEAEPIAPIHELSENLEPVDDRAPTDGPL